MKESASWLLSDGSVREVCEWIGFNETKERGGRSFFSEAGKLAGRWSGSK